MGKRGPEAQGGRGPLCLDVSFLGRREGEVPWATHKLE